MEELKKRDVKHVSGEPSASYQLLDFDTAHVVPGFVNETFILIVSGIKPYLNMEVALSPLIYVRQPEYWGIEVVGWIPGGIGLPAFGGYTVSKDLTGITGTKGIEVIGANDSLRIDVPPDSKKLIAVLRYNEKLCNENGNVKYRAFRTRNLIFLTAQGTHGTPGYRVFFMREVGSDVYPPVFFLHHRPPAHPVPQVETPFFAETHFWIDDKYEDDVEEIKYVLVIDAKDMHSVPVEKIDE